MTFNNNCNETRLNDAPFLAGHSTATAYKRKYKYGVVVAHNGTIFKYSIIDEKYNELNALFAIDNYYDLVYFNNSITSELYKKSVEKLFDAGIRMEMF